MDEVRMDTEEYRKKELRKGLPLQPIKFGDQSMFRAVGFRLGKPSEGPFTQNNI